MIRIFIDGTLAVAVFFALAVAAAQEPAPPVRGSLIEDRAAKKLVEAGDTRIEVDEVTKALEIWKSVIERYPRSRVRFAAHMRLGNYYLERDRAYDRARTHFEAATAEEHRDEDARAEATLKMGICFYHDRNYGKCFQVMRNVIDTFPVSHHVNNAYYYIGLGHFQLGHYSRAIAALEKVGTALSDDDDQVDRLEAGKRFFIKIEDADLAVLDPSQGVEVTCQAKSGDEEKVICYPVGRNVRVVLGSIRTQLGRPNSGNGALEVRGGDSIRVIYTDSHTAAQQLNQPVNSEVAVVGNAYVTITDGAFNETLRGVVLGKTVNVRISDADHDVSDNADQLTAVLEVYRQKTDEELEEEAAAAAIAAQTIDPPLAAADDVPLLDADEPQIERYKFVDRVEVALTEVKVTHRFDSEQPTEGLPTDPDGINSVSPAVVVPAANGASPAPKGDLDATAAATEPITEEPDNSIHSGVFQSTVPLIRAETVIEGDDQLQALPSDEIRVTYLDEVHRGEGIRQVVTKAKCLEGNIGGVRVARAVITDDELRIQTRLKTAGALTEIGNRYKEFGLKAKAAEKYQQALDVCNEVIAQARKIGGSPLEQTYVQLWKTYFEMESIPLAAAMCQRLQREFPNSGFVDDALLQLGDVARLEKDFQRAIGIYSRLVNMETSQLRGEAQFGIAECYEQTAEASEGPGAAQLRDRAFQAFKEVFDKFPESGRVGEAVAKMANYYYQQQDYGRAIDTFETVLNDHPDAKFLDVILFNYGRCLYRMGRKGQARQRFDQLIGDYPESALAPDAKKISEALARSGE